MVEVTEVPMLAPMMSEMVAADLFSVRQAISLIMGANIGTSVTSTIVALGQAGDPKEFRKAFAAATVHDMFNFCSVLILLPLEAICGYLYHFSYALLPAELKSGDKPAKILKTITKPFTGLILSVDKAGEGLRDRLEDLC